MKNEGGTLVKHYRVGIYGFHQVIFNLKLFWIISQYVKDILEFQPDVLIFIDYPGFNMRIAKWAKALGMKHIIIFLHKSGHGRK
jgi:lipid-A-disaccharide synthase